MPTSAAYARTLVQRKKAVLLPHPALPIIQLTHAVPDPVLRPVLLGIVIQPTTATVLVFTEPLGATPLIRLTLDLQHSTTAASRAIVVTALARTMNTLLPMSHTELLSDHPVTDDPAYAAAIHPILTTLEACLFYPITLLSLDTPRLAENPLLRVFLAYVLYRYEYEGFDLGGSWYLPDFWLPEHRAWFEVKGDMPTNDERHKAQQLAVGTGYPAAIFGGDV